LAKKEKDEQGDIVIEGNPELSETVLEYLATGKLNIPRDDPDLREKILQDLAQYKVMTPCLKKKKKLKWHWNLEQAKDNGIQLSKHGAYAISLGHDTNYLIGDTQLSGGIYEWKFKIGNAKGNVPLISLGVLDMSNEEDLFIEGQLVISSTWGVNSDGEKFSGNVEEIKEGLNNTWLMETGEEVVLKYDAEQGKLEIYYKKAKEAIVMENIKGKIYPYVHLNNPFDFVYTSIP